MPHKSPTYRWLKILSKSVLYIGVLLIILILVGLFYVNNKKDQLAKDSLRYVNEEIAGSIEVGSVHIASLFSYPEIALKLKDVKVFQPDSLDDRNPVIHVEKLIVSTNLNDILNNRFQLEYVDIQGGFLHIRKDDFGNTNISSAFYLPPIPDSLRIDSSSFFLGIDSIAMSNFHFLYLDESVQNEIPVSIKTLHGNLVYTNSNIGGVASIHSYIDTLRLGDSLSLPDLGFNIDANYAIELKDKTVHVKSDVGNLEQIPFNVDFLYDYGEVDNLALALNSTGKGFNLSKSVFAPSSVDIKKDMMRFNGYIEFKTNTTWKSNPEKSFLESTNIDLWMRGQNLEVIGIDIDKFIDRFNRSQNFNLVDLGAVLLAGPAGLAISKGADYTALALANAGDSCKVTHFQSNWNLKNGLLSTSDVAVSTTNNLVALHGWYDLKQEQLDFDINLVDRFGCSLITQRYYGPVKAPKAGRVKIIKTFLGPVTNLFRDIGMRNCDVVYAGVVEHPEVTAKREKKEAKQKKREDRQKHKHEN